MGLLAGIRERLRKVGLLRERHPFEPLGEIRELFCEWNALRLGISPEESRRRYRRSWNAAGGHGSLAFRSHCLRAYELFSVFFDDRDENRIHEVYAFYGPLHFLRMLAQPVSAWKEDDPLVAGLADQHEVTVLDFGCGLAQSSWGLARQLAAGGKRVRLVLADIPTLRKPFLLWAGERVGLPVAFVDCTPASACPALPPCRVAVALDVFEHLHDPLAVLRGLDAALLPGGFLVTDVADHRPEFMHVRPDLSAVRRALESLGYSEIQPNALYRKGPGRVGK